MYDCATGQNGGIYLTMIIDSVSRWCGGFYSWYLGPWTWADPFPDDFYLSRHGRPVQLCSYRDEEGVDWVFNRGVNMGRQPNQIKWDMVARKANFQNEREMFHELYLIQALGYRKVSELIGVSYTTVQKRVNELKYQKHRGRVESETEYKPSKKPCLDCLNCVLNIKVKPHGKKFPIVKGNVFNQKLIWNEGVIRCKEKQWLDIQGEEFQYSGIQAFNLGAKRGGLSHLPDVCELFV